jgi:hypothetical protein
VDKSYSEEFGAVLVQELGQRTGGAAGDPLERDRPVTCSMDEIPVATPIAIRCVVAALEGSAHELAAHVTGGSDHCSGHERMFPRFAARWGTASREPSPAT